MAYKNKEDRKAASKRWHKSHREQTAKAVREYHERILVWFNAFKATLKCMKCPESDPVCLDFHHRDANTKEVSISDALKRHWSIARIMKELEKCDVLCSNCHRKHHSVQRSFNR